MQDPFSPIEERVGTTLSMLKILKDHQYPTIISTKGSLVATDRYLDIIGGANIHVRLSAAGVAERFRASIDRRCSSFADTLKRIQNIASAGVAVSLRIQPVIPGHEKSALDMIDAAADAGASHVSIEYLKLPLEGASETISAIERAGAGNVAAAIGGHPLQRVGPDLCVPTDLKLQFIADAFERARALGIALGVGDTELIHLSDGDGCCNSSTLFLRDAKPFDANLTGLLKNHSRAEISFDMLSRMWRPSGKVTNYLMTDSRVRDQSGRWEEWRSLLAHRWNGGKGPYSPRFFAGVAWDGEIDEDGLKVFKYQRPL